MAPLLTELLMKDHFGLYTDGPKHYPPRGTTTNQSHHYHRGIAPHKDFQPPNTTQKNTAPSVSQNSISRPVHKMSHGSARSHSPDGSASNNSGGGAHTSKTGRKGDPRMHRAVAARLADPNLTLFEALKAGGFEYPDDNDPVRVDSEGITLAQRKNQLSRRIRIARRDNNFSKYPATSATDSKNKFESLVEKQKQSFQMMQQSMELERRSSSGVYASGGLKRSRSGPDNQANRQLGDPRRSLIDDEEDEAEAKQPAQMMAKFHPQFNPTFVPPGLQFAQSAPFPGQQSAAYGLNQAAGMLYPTQGFSVPNMGPLTTSQQQLNPLNGMSVGASTPAAASSANVSGVALRSLTNTAQSVGLTLEQLALALSSTRNLAHIVLGDEDEKNPASANEQKKKKQDLALELYQHEVRPVYARCMLLAGFKSELTSETSKDYLKFAWKAWQKEGKRLRDLLEENDFLVADAPDFAANLDEEGNQRPGKKSKTSPQEDSNEGTNGVTYSHSHGRDCHTADGRHIHRLEKCGHKAILHQPKDGEAHIDFVVGDKVECYEGIPKDEDTKWPSQYPCENCDQQVPRDRSDSVLAPPGTAPKILDLKSIDLQGNEWNIDFVDETLNGLVRLGEGDMQGNNSDASQEDTTKDPPMD